MKKAKVLVMGQVARAFELNQDGKLVGNGIRAYSMETGNAPALLERWAKKHGYELVNVRDGKILL